MSGSAQACLSLLPLHTIQFIQLHVSITLFMNAPVTMHDSVYVATSSLIISVCMLLLF